MDIGLHRQRDTQGECHVVVEAGTGVIPPQTKGHQIAGSHSGQEEARAVPSPGTAERAAVNSIRSPASGTVGPGASVVCILPMWSFVTLATGPW